jgi:23S rRNA (uridine2552-2'-O)-methyltransferase
MGKKNNPRSDDYYNALAKKEGYPARSVYKLMEIQKRFAVFRRESSVLDVGAAPGSWSLYVLRNISEKGFLASIDLKPLEIKWKGSNFKAFEGDAFSDENISRIMETGLFDTVLSDAAPATTGNRIVDTGKSLQLVTSVIDLADKVLKPGGDLVLKIFQGGEEKQVMEKMRMMFSSVKAFKPDAVRKISFETYLIGKGKKSRSLSGESANG